jgi:hypothetical protein
MFNNPNEPPSLAWRTTFEKSLEDPFTYRMGLRDGSVIEYAFAEDHGEFVELDECAHFVWPPELAVSWKFQCGISVRKSAIAWVADLGRGDFDSDNE